MMLEYPPRKTTDEVHRADLDSCEQLAHVIKYNLALCYHLKYIQADDDDDDDHDNDNDNDNDDEVRASYLHRALQLYENVQDLVMAQLDDDDAAAATTLTTRTAEEAAASSSWWLLLQHMAVATNLGHIYYTREEPTKGDWSMQIVLSTLLQCTTSTMTTQEEDEVFFGHTTNATTPGRSSSSSSRVLAGFFKLLLPPPPARAA